MLNGDYSPLYWKTIVKNAPQIEKSDRSAHHFPRQALKALYVFGDNEEYYFIHYRVDRKHKGFPKYKTYKGINRDESKVWVAKVKITKIDKNSIIVQDHSRENEEGSNIPIKKLLIDKIVNVTGKDGADVDFSKYLRKAKSQKYLNVATYIKNHNLKGKYYEKMAMTRLAQKQEEIQKRIWPPAKKIGEDNEQPQQETPLVNLRMVHEETKEKLQDYWNYLDPNYAKAIVKNY